MNAKYFIGPMTQNVVDAVIEFSNNTGIHIGLIPSRRQVEDTGGYVNNWNTKTFSQYVKSKSNNIILQRDHGGPGQGNNDDTGLLSLAEDCKYFNLIHIDPWKKYPLYEQGLDYTINLIKFCYQLNKQIEFEIGTEQSIRKFEVNELEQLINDLKNKLPAEIYNQIKYLVIQSGTSLKGTNQTGNYDTARLKEMIEVCNRHNLISKEHNGDYIPVSIIKEKFDLGLNSINIAPEFGLIETKTYLDYINGDTALMHKFWDICYQSGKWQKWVDPTFDPIWNKIDIINIAGHYVISDPKFLGIKEKFPYINKEIQQRVTNKLLELHGL